MRQEYIDRRTEELANYIVKTGATVRHTARAFGISKSTVHKDITERLYEIDRPLYKRVSRVLQKNKAERHIRGGQATREKYRGDK